jgi:hypothetical protein
MFILLARSCSSSGTIVSSPRHRLVSTAYSLQIAISSIHHEEFYQIDCAILSFSLAPDSCSTCSSYSSDNYY